MHGGLRLRAGLYMICMGAGVHDLLRGAQVMRDGLTCKWTSNIGVRVMD